MIRHIVNNVWQDTSDHECEGVRYHHTYRLAVYGSAGERVAVVQPTACYVEESLLDPQFVADSSAPQWPGRTVCVWRDHTAVAPERLFDARPDATAGGRHVQ